MAQLAIKAHPIRTKEVIEILEMLGGRNEFYYTGNHKRWVYGIDEDGTIVLVECEKKVTLEEFLEKFPYKVGDKVVRRNSTSCATVHVIEKMRWNNSCVEYTIRPLHDPYSSGVDFAENLRPYEDEPMDGELICDEKIYLKLGTLKPMTARIIFSADSPNETELVLGDNFEVKVNDGKTYVVKKKKDYPTFKNLGECKEILGEKDMYQGVSGYKGALLTNFQRLLIFRDAYWKLAGDWKPDWSIYEHKFCIGTDKDKVIEECVTTGNRILSFPTEEMRDAFYENFKELIELVKELL